MHMPNCILATHTLLFQGVASKTSAISNQMTDLASFVHSKVLFLNPILRDSQTVRVFGPSRLPA